MRLFLTVAFLLVGLVVGCSSEADYLELTWMEFDQDPDGGWRPLAHAGDYAGAAKMIEIYLAHHPDLPDAPRGYSTLHAGQLLALNGETDRAIAFFESFSATLKLIMNLPFPEQLEELAGRCALGGIGKYREIFFLLTVSDSKSRKKRCDSKNSGDDRASHQL